MDKKKVIKIIRTSIIVVIVVLLFMSRVTIFNNIEVVKVKLAVRSRYRKPDYQIEFINNIEEFSNRYRCYCDRLLIFLKDNKIIYSDEANKKNKIFFTIGDYPYYWKTKVKNLDKRVLEEVQKYEVNKFLLTPEKTLNKKEQVGDIQISSAKYSENNIEEIKLYFIPKSNNTELHNILTAIKK